MIASPLMVIPAFTASSRASVTSRPALLVPSPHTSITRRCVSKPLSASNCTAAVDAGADRGAAPERARRGHQLVGEGLRRGLVADHAPVEHGAHLEAGGELDIGDGDRADVAVLDRLDHLARGEGGGIALLLQLELRIVDAARDVGDQDQRQIDAVAARACAERREGETGREQPDSRAHGRCLQVAPHHAAAA